MFTIQKSLLKQYLKLLLHELVLLRVAEWFILIFIAAGNE